MEKTPEVHATLKNSAVFFLTLWLFFSGVLVGLMIAFLTELLAHHTSPGFIHEGWFVFLGGGCHQLLFFAGVIYLSWQSPYALKTLWAWKVPSAITLAKVIFSAFFLCALFIGISELFPPKIPTPIEQYLRTKSDLFVLILVSLSLAPIIEEIFFRGLFYPYLEKTLSKFWGIFLVAGIFAILHIPQLQGYYLGIFLLFVLGVILTTLRAFSRSTTLTFVFHFTYNFGWCAWLWIKMNREMEMLLAGG